MPTSWSKRLLSMRSRRAAAAPAQVRGGEVLAAAQGGRRGGRQLQRKGSGRHDLRQPQGAAGAGTADEVEERARVWKPGPAAHGADLETREPGRQVDASVHLL